MTYLVGTDEAGYGPNLGPLVIGATLWRVPDELDGEQLYEALPAVVPPGGRRAAANTPRLIIGDSKKLYSPHGSLGALERGVYAALAATKSRSPTTSTLPVLPQDWRELLLHFDDSCAEVLGSVPWYAGFERTVPVDIGPDELEQACRLLLDSLAQGRVELVRVAAQIVFPARFNERVRQCGSKGQALSLWTLELIERLICRIDDGPIVVQSDKHGGRNRYAALLQHVFPDDLIVVREESRAQSVYRFGSERRRIEARFTMQGERFLPSALASMMAKYLRELAMAALNDYWLRQVPGLRPTAGYPVDAKRFLSDIEQRRRALGIAMDDLWRER